MDEPLGGAHRNFDATFAATKVAISSMMKDLSGKSPKHLIADRRKRFLSLGSNGLAA